jgi:hypothetical protein
MKPLNPSEPDNVAGGKAVPELIDGPTFPLEPLPVAEALPAELNPEFTIR